MAFHHTFSSAADMLDGEPLSREQKLALMQEPMDVDDWRHVITTVDGFLADAVGKDHGGPGDALQIHVESWSAPMRCVLAVYLFQRGQPEIAQHFARMVFPPEPVLLNDELHDELPWAPM